METREYKFDKGYDISIVIDGKVKRIITDITRRNDKKKLDKLNEYLIATYNIDIVELHEFNSGLNRNVTLTIDTIVEFRHNSGCCGFALNNVIVFVNGEVIELEQKEEVSTIGKLTSTELESVISSGDIQLIYGWLLNEYCYCRSENVKLLFEPVKYNIVELIRNDKSLQDKFKLNLIETLNKLK